MDSREVRRFRKKHKKCKWCKYYRHCYKCEWDWEECILKDKYLNPLFNKIRAKFCKYYQIKETKNENNNL